MREPIPLGLLVPLRLFTGFALLRSGAGKLLGGWLTSDKVQTAVAGWLHDGKTYGFFAPFLRDRVLPHGRLFSVLLVGGEVCVGAALFLGLFTRLTALFGLALGLCLFFAQGEELGANLTSGLVALSFTFLLVPAGRAFGCDAALRGKVPRWLS